MTTDMLKMKNWDKAYAEINQKNPHKTVVKDYIVLELNIQTSHCIIEYKEYFLTSGIQFQAYVFWLL